MKITSEQEDLLESARLVDTTPGYPWGEKCPSCGRPHVFLYTDGTKLCEKCGELVRSGSLLSGRGAQELTG